MRKSNVKSLGVALVACGLSGLTVAGDRGGYGAIALDKRSGHFGWSVNQPSQAMAEHVALGHCGPLCTPLVWWAHGCGALVRSSRAYATGIAPARSAAERQALGRCPEGNCVIVLSRCSGNAR